MKLKYRVLFYCRESQIWNVTYTFFFNSWVVISVYVVFNMVMQFLYEDLRTFLNFGLAQWYY